MFLKVFVVALVASVVHAQQYDYLSNSLCQGKAVDLDKILNDYRRCLMNIVDYQELQNEMLRVIIFSNSIHNAYNVGFRSYCTKSSLVKSCVHDYIKDISPCLDDDDKEMFNNDISDQIIDYVCHNNAERITSFISAEGLECVGAKADKLKECFSTTIGALSDEDLNKKSEKEQCDMADSIIACAVTTLKSCNPATPGYIAEELFSFLMTLTPCKQSGHISHTTHPRFRKHISFSYPTNQNHSMGFPVTPATIAKHAKMLVL